MTCLASLRTLIVATILSAIAPDFIMAKARRVDRSIRSIQTVEGQRPSSELSYLQRILQIENRRISNDKFLVACLSHSSRRVVRAALVALGRIGDTSALDEMAHFLSKRDVDYAETAAFALSLMEGDIAPKILSQSLVLQKDIKIRAAILLGLGRSGLESSIPTLTNVLLTETTPALLDAAAHGIALAWSGDSEKWLLPDGLMTSLASLSQGSEPMAVSAAVALSRFKGDPKLLPYKQIYNNLSKVKSSDARALLIRSIGKIKSALLAVRLTDWLKNDSHLGTRMEAAIALRAQVPTPTILEVFKKVLRSDVNRALIVTCLNTVARYGIQAFDLSNEIDALTVSHPSNWVRSVALKTLAHVSAEKARERATEWMKDLLHPLYGSALAARVVLGTLEDLDAVVPILVDAPANTVVEVLEEMSSLSEGKFSSSLKTILKRLLFRNDVAITSWVAQLAQKFKWKDYAVVLVSSYSVFKQEDQIEAKLSILNAIGVIGDKSQYGFLENVTNEPQKLIVSAAVNALKSIGGKDLSMKIPLNSKILEKVPDWEETKKAVKAAVLMKTNRGDIALHMMEDTPVTAYHFIQWAKTGFYNGKVFHRVVPNFVVQGGDPLGNGFGGPGFLIRDELTPKKHLQGTVGIATAGHDTGGSQFFINQGPNLHLGGKYTLFAEIVSGFEVVQKLEWGDKILSIDVK